MPNGLRFPADMRKDDEFLAVAFDDWKQSHGYHDTIRLGDLDTKSVSQVLGRAQKLKQKFQEQSR